MTGATDWRGNDIDPQNIVLGGDGGGRGQGALVACPGDVIGRCRGRLVRRNTSDIDQPHVTLTINASDGRGVRASRRAPGRLFNDAEF